MITPNLHVLMSRLSLASFFVISSLSFSSCQDEDFGYSAEQIKYSKNFTEKYGPIPADKNWDLTTWANLQSSSAAGTMNTRAGGSENPNGTFLNSESSNPDFEIASEYVVPDNLMTWMKENLIEGRDNRSLGSSFMLRLPQNDFAIIPIFQGNSAFMSELELKVNTRKITKIWEKSQNMWAKDSETDEWHKLGYYDGWPTYDHYYSTKTEHAASTLYAYSVKTKPIIFHPDRMVSNSSDDNRLMYLSLRNIDKLYMSDDEKWDPNDEWATLGDRLTSINSHGYMLALPVPFTISSLPPIAGYNGECNTMLVGCEDASGVSSDHDTNDIVFLIVGYPNVPEIVSTTETIKKRYMCEDLGATDDFDFNDIVVDVTQTRSWTIKTVPGDQADNEKSDGNFELKTEYRDYSQTARLAHVCGTLPFQVVVGNTIFPKVIDPTILSNTREELSHQTTTRAQYDVRENGWNPNEVKKVEGWDPENNNIKIYVDWSGGNVGTANSSEWKDERPNPNVNDPTPEDLLIAEFDNGKFKVVSFPAKGTVPYIIATDQDVPWMAERVDIPSSWVDQQNPSVSDHSGAASDQGNHLNKAEDDEEVVLYNGPFTCTEAYSTGVHLNRLSEFHTAIIEAIEAGYNTLNVYTSGPTGDIGLICIPNDGKWHTLTPEDAETYFPGEDLAGGINKHTIWLTNDQIRRMKQLGVFVIGRADNIVIERITMTKVETKELTLVYPRYGKIQFANDSPTKAGRTRYQKVNNAVPFEKAAFPKGSEIKLTATPYDGSTFNNWLDNKTESTRTITLDDNITIGASFTNGNDPQFHVKEPKEFIDNGVIPTHYPGFGALRFWQSNEQQDLNFESVKVIDETHTTIVLDCDKYTTDETGFVLQTGSKASQAVSIRMVSEENQGATSMTWKTNTPDVIIKTTANSMGKTVFEMWQPEWDYEGQHKDESVHIFVTVYAKKKSFVMTDVPEAIDLDYVNPNKVINFSWIRQNKLNLSLKNESGIVGAWTNNSDNTIHIDAKKSSNSETRDPSSTPLNDRLVINYSGSDHYLGVYREIPVTVTNYSWDECGMHLLRVNGVENSTNEFTVTDGQIALATQNWSTDKNIKVVVHFKGYNLDNITLKSSKSGKTDVYTLNQLTENSKFICRLNKTYAPIDDLPKRSLSFIVKASDYADLFAGANMIFNIANSSDLKPEFYVTETTEEPYTTNIDLLTKGCGEDQSPKNGTHGWEPVLDEERTAVYGLGSNYQTERKYDNLYSPVKYLKVVAYNGYEVPRFFFNYIDGTGNDGITITKGSPYLFHDVVTIEEVVYDVYYINVEQLRTDKGNAYLNAITSSSWDTKIKVKSIKLGIPNN